MTGFVPDLDQFFERRQALRLAKWLVGFATHHSAAHPSREFIEQFTQELLCEAIEEYEADPEEFVQRLFRDERQ